MVSNNNLFGSLEGSLHDLSLDAHSAKINKLFKANTTSTENQGIPFTTAEKIQAKKKKTKKNKNVGKSYHYKYNVKNKHNSIEFF